MVMVSLMLVMVIVAMIMLLVVMVSLWSWAISADLGPRLSFGGTLAYSRSRGRGGWGGSGGYIFLFINPRASQEDSIISYKNVQIHWCSFTDNTIIPQVCSVSWSRCHHIFVSIIILQSFYPPQEKIQRQTEDIFWMHKYWDIVWWQKETIDYGALKALSGMFTVCFSSRTREQHISTCFYLLRQELFTWRCPSI